MVEYEWAQILTLAYENNGMYSVSTDVSDVEGVDELRKQNKAALLRCLQEVLELETEDTDEIDEILSRMENLGLIDYAKGKRKAVIRLEPDGFEVAHDREQAIGQQAASTASAFLTGVLALAVIIQSAIQMATIDVGLFRTVIMATVVVLALIILALTLYQFSRAGIFDLNALIARRERFR